MDERQRIWMTCFTPLLLLYSIFEIKRGWNILKHKKYSLNFAYSAQIWLVNTFQGEKKSIEYKEKLFGNVNQMTLSGYYRIIGGIVLLAACIFWAYLLIKF
jgi:hypothetical protein